MNYVQNDFAHVSLVNTLPGQGHTFGRHLNLNLRICTQLRQSDRHV